MQFSGSRILRISEMVELLAVSRATLWRWERRGVLPPKRRIGPNVVGWIESEITEWLQTRPSGVAVLPEDLAWKEPEE